MTPTQELISLKLGADGPLDQYVSDRRANGRSWRLIASDIYDATGMDVTYESLRSWFPEQTEVVS